MDRKWASGAAVSPPALDNASDGYATAGNPGGGVSATKPGAHWYHMITEEIMSVIVAAGLTPDKASVVQLRDSVPLLANVGRVGNVFFHASSAAPTNALKANGASVSRATYAALFTVMGTQHNKTFTANSGTDNLTCTSHGISTATDVDVAAWDGGTLPAPLAGDTTYYARSVDANTISLHPTAGDATGNTNKIDLTSAGSGKLTIAPRTTFQVPDVRGEFLRGWDDGRGVDSGRVFGSAQAAATAAHTHTIAKWNLSSIDADGGASCVGADTNGSSGTDQNTGSTGGTETRPRNVALLACVWYQ